MYSTRFSGRPRDNGTHDQKDTAPSGSMPPLITSLQAWQPNNIRRQKEKHHRKKGVGWYQHTLLHTLEGGDQQVAPNPNPHLQRT
jgi:hypothetical protein